jgi:hypothetical protein
VVQQRPKGQPLAVDPNAVSANPAAPAFVAPPRGSPAYHGFPVLKGVCVDGFTFGAITDFEAEACTEGDAFVVAPDGSRAGLVWAVTTEKYFRRVLPFEECRWGVWEVSFPLPMVNRENAGKNLESILPELRGRWEEWKQRYRRG